MGGELLPQIPLGLVMVFHEKKNEGFYRLFSRSFERNLAL